MEMDNEVRELFEKYKAITKDTVAAAILTQTQLQNDVVVPPPDEIDCDPEMLTVDIAAKLIKCSPMTVYRLVKNGTLKASRFGVGKRQIRIARAVLDEYLDDQPPDDKPPEKAIWR